MIPGGGRARLPQRLIPLLLLLAAGMIPAVSGGAGVATAAWHVPVLMYHRVDPRLQANDPITVHLTIMTPAFEAQLRLLADQGYHTMALADLWAALAGGRPVPPRRIILTFDDGYDDAYTVVFPLLRRYGFTATFFIVTSTVGTHGHVTAAQIQEMARSGMEIESHGVHHIDFSLLSHSDARAELTQSRRTIEGWTGRPVAFFAYPAGRWNLALTHILSDLGYHAALTEVPGFVGPASAPYALERLRVDHDDTLAAFASKLGIRSP